MLSRRSFVRRATLFLPLAFFAASAVRTAKATSVIIQRTISGGSEKAVQMINSTWARPVVLTPGWTKIRVGMRWHFTSTGANLTGNQIFAMGFNSGTVNQYGSPSSQNFIGMAWDTTTWTFQASPIIYAVPTNGSNPQYRTRIGTTNVSSAVQAGGGNYTMNAGALTGDADRQIQFVDITNGSPNYSIHCPFTANLGNQVSIGDVTAANFLSYMALPNAAPSEGQYQTASINTGSLAFSESVNVLNAINFYWNRVDLSPEICDVAVAVLA